MGNVSKFTKPAPRTDVSVEVGAKLEQARSRLAELEGQADAAALSAALNELGAAGKLAQLLEQLEAARREVEQLERALRLAEQRDAAAQAAIDAKARREQLGAMQVHAARRLEAMIALCEASQKAAAAYIDFLDATDAMALAMPSGLISHSVSWHLLPLLLDGREFPGRVEVAVAAELYRHGVTRADGRGMLPGAQPPTEKQRLQPAAIEPASAAVARQNAYVLGLIDARLKSLEQANGEKFSKSA